MDTSETIVYQRNGVAKLSKDGHVVDIPDGWEFVPSGDPALTRRIKAAAKDYWVVKKSFGKREFAIGLCAPKGLAKRLAEQLEAERATPEYQQKLEAGRRRRAREQQQYCEDFEAAVFSFLNFHSRWRELAEHFAKTVTLFTTPVGSGTVARTERIPIQDRARAAVIAWMRHNTSDYDHRYIPRIAGKRREVRRDIAQDSLRLLDIYRRGGDAPQDCPLLQALGRTPVHDAEAPGHPQPQKHAAVPEKPGQNNVKPHSSAPKHLSTKLSEGDFWL